MGAGSAFKNDKNRPSCTYPLGSYMYEVGWKKSIFFTKMLLFFESNAFPAPPAVFPGRPCPRNMASKKVPVEVTCGVWVGRACGWVGRVARVCPLNPLWPSGYK